MAPDNSYLQALYKFDDASTEMQVRHNFASGLISIMFQETDKASNEKREGTQDFGRISHRRTELRDALLSDLALPRVA